MWQYLSTRANLLDGEGISCSQPSTGHPTRLKLALGQGCGWALPKRHCPLSEATKFLPIFSSLADTSVLCGRIDSYLELFIICSTLTKIPVLAGEKEVWSMILPPPCFTSRRLLFCCCAVLFLWQTNLLELWPKVQSCSALGPFACFLGNFPKFHQAWKGICRDI